MSTKRKRPRLVQVQLTRRQWELVYEALGECYMGCLSSSKGEIHWKTAQALEDARMEVATAAGHSA